MNKIKFELLESDYGYLRGLLLRKQKTVVNRIRINRRDITQRNVALYESVIKNLRGLISNDERELAQITSILESLG